MKTLIIFLFIIIIGLVIYYKWRIKRHKETSLGRGLKRKSRITNDKVQNLLGVSDATATRYLDELEKEGLIEQIGGAKRDTYYRLKS